MELKLEHVTKQYKDKIALDDFSITLTLGIYGILGENGAGKSTLMNLITDNSKRTSGNILLDGKEILHMGAEYRRHIGYMPQQQGEYPNFSALSFLLYMAEAKGIKKKQARKEAEELLELVNLDDVKKKKVNTFSGGMKQRVMLAQALLGGPDILLLDEPTAGLDPKERIRIRNLILKLSKQKIILLATHVVSDIACIADKVLLLKQGKLLRVDTPNALIQSMEHKVWKCKCPKEQIEEMQIRYPYGNLEQRKDGVYMRIISEQKEDSFTLEATHMDLEDVYLYYCADAKG